MNVKLISMTEQPEILIEKAYRVCYDSSMSTKSFTRRKFISNLISRGHLTPLEHAVATFEITCSRAASHQLVRHRLCSFSQQSQRYCKQSQSSMYLIPDSVTKEDHVFRMYCNNITDSLNAYENLINKGVPKEDARCVLPAAMATTLVATANFRQWRHVINLRCSKDAQWEIRDIAKKILMILYDYAPSVFEDLYERTQI